MCLATAITAPSTGQSQGQSLTLKPYCRIIVLVPSYSKHHREALKCTCDRLISLLSSEAAHARFAVMGIVRAILDQPEEFPPLVRMAWAAHKAKRLPKEPHLACCYDMLNLVGRRYAACEAQATAGLSIPP